MLLDTCGLLWLAHDQEKLSANTRHEINDVPIVYVSAISAFEIGIKHKSGKLVLPVSPKEWFSQIVTHHDLSVIDLDSAICMKATELPDIHKDPCDRFIIATALIKGFSVVTSDNRFKEYGVTTLI